MKMRIALGLFFLGLMGLCGLSSTARACGGLFCNRAFAPVDQSAERIVFKVNADDTVRMIVQVSYQGSAEDFAWILPLPDVPDAETLGTFPMAALTALDAGTAPSFLPPTECNGGSAPSSSGCGFSDSDVLYSAAAESGMENGVDIHIRKRVGDYEAVVVGSDDPMLLINWLVDNDYNVTQPMLPYIRRYAQNGMKFLALKLVDGASVNDIAPIDLTLPGQTPSIPLTITALAAEPEMSIVVIVLADQRFAGANWPDVNVEVGSVAWALEADGTFRSAWSRRVAEQIDAAGGYGWVTELSSRTADVTGSVSSMLSQQTGPGGEPLEAAELERASAALGDLSKAEHITRLYTRVSAEEMVQDPVFKRVEDGEGVDRVRRLSRQVDGRDMCPVPGEPREVVDPCEFSTCGAKGMCRQVSMEDREPVAGCACAAGTTARSTTATDGTQTVICQDQRLSFVNPGIVDMVGGASVVMEDPCESVKCGPGATCVAMNMTPTCVCAKGMVAVAGASEQGTTCVVPDAAIPEEFYLQPVQELDPSQEIGRDEVVMVADTPEGVELPTMSMGELGGGGGFEGCTVRQARRPLFGTVFSVLFALAFIVMRRFDRQRL